MAHTPRGVACAGICPWGKGKRSSPLPGKPGWGCKGLRGISTLELLAQGGQDEAPQEVLDSYTKCVPLENGLGKKCACFVLSEASSECTELSELGGEQGEGEGEGRWMMKCLPCFEARGHCSCVAQGHIWCQWALCSSPAHRRAVCAFWGRSRQEKASSGAGAGSHPGTAEDARSLRRITKGEACCADPLCRALLNTTALVGTRPARRAAPLSHLLSDKSGRQPHSSWASKEKSNFLNAFC